MLWGDRHSCCYQMVADLGKEPCKNNGARPARGRTSTASNWHDGLLIVLFFWNAIAIAITLTANP